MDCLLKRFVFSPVSSMNTDLWYTYYYYYIQNIFGKKKQSKCEIFFSSFPLLWS